MRNLSKYLVFPLLVFFLSCNQGLSPESVKPGFGGKVIFIGEWPDSVTRTHIVLFKNPLLSVNDFNVNNLKFVSDSIPFGTSEFEYKSTDENSLIEDIADGYYSYLAVAQSTSTILSLLREDWVVAGIYAEENSLQPKVLYIPPNTFVGNVNIICDFESPPPQPPGE